MKNVLSRFRRTLRASVLALLWLAVVASALTGASAAGSQVAWTAEPARADARAGEVVLVTLTARIQDGWHLYSTTTPPGGPRPTQFTVDPMAAEPGGTVFQRKPGIKFDETFGVDTEIYEGTTQFVVPVKIPAGASGKLTVPIAASYMVCDPSRCVPGTAAIEAIVDVAPGTARSEFATAKAPPGFVAGTAVTATKPAATTAPQTAPAIGPPSSGAPAGPLPAVPTAPADTGLLAFLGLAITVGFASLLTPCVFPMIPITVSYFTKNDGRTRARGVLDAAVYALSIIATFTILGVAVALLFGATGVQQFAANPFVNAVLAIVFVTLALNLFGFFEVIVPGSVLTALGRKSDKGGFLGTVLMAFTFTLTSFTCTVPFVGTVLVSASQGEWVRPLVGMLGYATAFALPFFLLALFPQALSAMPRAGGWMISIKVVMGFLELAAAMKFISNVDLVMGWQHLTRELFLSVWVAIAFVTAMYLMGKIHLPHERAVESIGVMRMLASTLFLALGFYLVAGLFGSRLGELEAFLPPISSTPASASASRVGTGELEWLHDYDEALGVARASGKPLMIDFTGYACTNCRWMEKNVFPVPEVRAELERFVRVQLYTDGQGAIYDRNRVMQETRFGTVALPLYIVVDPTMEQELGRHEGLTRDPAVFAAFLRQSRGPAVAMR